MKRTVFRRVTAAALACMTAVLGCIADGGAALRSNAALDPIDEPSKEYAEAVVALVNAARLKEGLPQLPILPILLNASDIRAEELAVNYSHYRPDGSIPDTVLLNEGFYFAYIGENNGKGNATPAHIAEAWLNSTKHRNTIMNENKQTEYTHIGVGYHYDEAAKMHYWNMLLIANYEFGTHQIYDDQYLPKVDHADPDGSMTINARDASLILEYSAAEAAGVEYPVIYSFEDAADVNSDGSIDSIDASIILCYTAAKGAGEDAALEDFIW
ncbi:MAG: hypothetical protein II341_06585 [Oscillospiraceae bacterium]|nr:hypothetical protein [Oscillospiraceae bacterium]